MLGGIRSGNKAGAAPTKMASRPSSLTVRIEVKINVAACLMIALLLASILI